MGGMIDNLLGRGYDLNKEIDTLRAEAHTINGLKQMVETVGWQKLRDYYLKKIMECDAAIVILAADADKNDRAIHGKYMLRTIIKGLLTTVETTLAVEAEILKRIEKLETIRSAAPFRDTLGMNL